MESVPDKLRVSGTGFGRALPSGMQATTTEIVQGSQENCLPKCYPDYLRFTGSEYKYLFYWSG